MKLKDFLAQTHLNESLVRAVVSQYGTWSEFQESAEDMRQADAGWNGFTYYSDTVKFAQRNRNAIRESLRELASDIGAPSWLHVVAGFNCIDLSVSEIEEAFYASKADGGDNYTQLYNTLAWYALETVAGAVADCREAA